MPIWTKLLEKVRKIYHTLWIEIGSLKRLATLPEILWIGCFYYRFRTGKNKYLVQHLRNIVENDYLTWSFVFFEKERCWLILKLNGPFPDYYYYWYYLRQPFKDQCSPPYRNHSIDLQSKSFDPFLYDEEHWSLMG